MQLNRYFLFFAVLFTSYQCYCRNINDFLRDHPDAEVSAIGHLDLSYHNIDSLEGLANIPNIDRVVVLDLHNNELHEIDDSAFAMMLRLEHIDLSNNEMYAVGKNLFATPRVRVNISGNRLPEEHLKRLEIQLSPGRLLQTCSSAFRTVDRVEGRVADFVNAAGMARLGRLEPAVLQTCIFLAKLGIYGGLKLALFHPRLAKANFLLDTACHGANIANFIIRCFNRPPSVRACLNCLENGVHLYNMFKAPATVSGNIQSRFGINLVAITTDRWIDECSWLPFWRQLPWVPYPIQDAMMLPWSLCPSKTCKVIKAASGFLSLNNVVVLPIFNRIKTFVENRAAANTGVLIDGGQHPLV